MQFCIDKKHLQYMKRFYGNIELGPFLPLAGTSYADININANTDIAFNKFIDYDNFLSNRNIDIILREIILLHLILNHKSIDSERIIPYSTKILLMI